MTLIFPACHLFNTCFCVGDVKAVMCEAGRNCSSSSSKLLRFHVSLQFTSCSLDVCVSENRD